MDLPSLEQLCRREPETWHSLQEWLIDLGATPDQVAPLVDVARDVPELLRVPLIHYHLRQRSGPLPVVLRLLFFGERIDVDELVAQLGADRLEWLRDIGLVTCTGSVAHSPFEIGLFGTRLVLADPHLVPGDLVMGAWRATGSLLELALPGHRIARALDLGCGAGALALGLSGVAEHVVMTDIYPRAIDFGRINLALNRANNVEPRVGDLYEPVAGETFDLVVCQPPFVSAPPEDFVTYLHGGTRGDELVRRILRGLVEHLAPRGRAFLYLQMPNERGRDLLETMRELIGPHAALLLLEDGELDLDEYCSVHESRSLSEGTDVYARRVQRRREHLDRTGITSITSAYLLVIKQEPAFAHVYQTSGLVWGNTANADIESLLAGVRLAYHSEPELMASKLTFRGEPRFFETEAGIRIDSPPLQSLLWDKERFGLLLAATQAPVLGELRGQLMGGDERTRRLAAELPSVVLDAARQGLIVPELRG